MPGMPMGQWFSSLLCAVLLLLSAAGLARAGEIQPAAVSGDFVYTRAKAGSEAPRVIYRVEAASYHGVDAWRIAWSDACMKTVLYFRRSDGAPIYTRRVNRMHPETVEIAYSLDPSKPTIYRRKADGKTLVRRIQQHGLIDLGSLPQILAGMQANGDADTLHFSIVNYSDGRTYALQARRTGYTTLATAGREVRCAVYEVNLDSWLAAFIPATRLQLPTSAGLANFAAYSGPNPDGSKGMITLHMQSAHPDVAMLQQPARVEVP